MSAPPRDWYLPLAAHLRSAYLRYAFTFGTEQEVEFLCGALGVQEGSRLLDVGCGPGRHAVSFARRGLDVVGIDLSPDFIAVARRKAKEAGVKASFFEMDAHHLPFEEEFQAAISICEGAFGLGLGDLAILKGMARAVVPGGRLAVGAVNVFYVIKHMEEGTLDPATMLYQETSEVIGEDGVSRRFEMWNSCYTPRELEWIANGAGLDPEAVYGVEPGAYRGEAPTFNHPELLLLAAKP